MKLFTPSMTAGLASLLVILPAAAQNISEAINEDEMFSDTVTVVQDTTGVVTDTVTADKTKDKSVSLSGEVNTVAQLILPRVWFDSLRYSKDNLSSYTVANLMLDVRLPNSIKAFGNLETQYNPSGSKINVGLRELFVDGNINYRVYLRAGKQVLQWGRCYFFNPTDLINVEKKLFIQKIGYREGAYGLRTHIPFGTLVNIYGFIDTREATSIEKLAGAAKVELLAGGTEMALSLWGKRQWNPVYAFDISSRLGLFNIAGELSISYGDNYKKLSLVNDTLITTRTDSSWIPRVAVSISRFFKVQGIPDRLMITGEFYYNHGGYRDNGFKDDAIYAYSEPLKVSDTSGTTVVIGSGTKRMYLENSGLYEMNNYSKYYAALFTQLSRFITSDITLQCNAIGNIAQKSALVTAGINYLSINNFTMGLLFMAFLGPEKTEYTYHDGALSVRISAGLVF